MNAYDISYYNNKLLTQYNIVYTIHPITEWHGLRTIVNIYCPIHKTYKTINLQKIFNGKRSVHPCHICCINNHV